MLSGDLEMLRMQLKEQRNANGEVVLPPSAVKLVGFVLDDCVSQAKHLEASRVQRQPMVVDLSDPKIALFPVAKRPVPIPIRTPDDGGVA